MRRDKDDEEGVDKDGNDLNTVDTSTEDEYESLIDYTLKGGLRGTLLLLNSTTSSATQVGGNLTTSEMKNLTQAAKMVMKEEEEMGEEGQEGGEEGGTHPGGIGNGGILTEEGVRLRMPIVVKKHPAELGKYGAKITFYHSSEQPTKFIYYGNWCGRGGRSAPVDQLDRCCLEQDKCYGRGIRHCPDVWKKPYSRMYAWTLLEGRLVCVRSESSCVNHICECDREASTCFHTFLHNISANATITHVGTKTL
ncbi:hypothetical protein Pcinc_039006 [Petrolisthes cinctipes]|uniref:Phospholipase A2-like central domain-containing protein n=1 Tax=Petrolisthes cinctipes TaxID=88211 RepID=A0AAE1BSK0_PETCI|nr:hypothetical protein Pcinc_039006 [Petrolisthes cinctipes]